MKRFFINAYIHVLSVFGGVAFLAMLSELFQWQGFLPFLIDYWKMLFHPFADFLLLPFTLSLEWLLGFPIQFPDWLKDYLAVGGTMCLSRWRGISGGWNKGYSRAVSSMARNPLATVILGLRTLLVWPVELVHLFLGAAIPHKRFPEFPPESMGQIRRTHIYALLPVVYAVAMFALNSIVVVFDLLP